MYIESILHRKIEKKLNIEGYLNNMKACLNLALNAKIEIYQRLSDLRREY